MNILLTGATGFIGGHILRALLSEGHQVTACVRDSEEFQKHFPGVTAITCDFAHDQSISNWSQRLDNIDVVINAVGIICEHKQNTFSALHKDSPIALFDACNNKGVKQVIQISALGADDSATSSYHLSKLAADKHLAQSDLSWTILRPSIVYGPRGKSIAFFQALASLPLIPVVDKGDQLIQPIHINDLVGVVIKTLNNPGISRRILNVVGPAPVSFRQFLLKQREWLGLTKGRFVSMPYHMALVFSGIAGKFGNTLLNRESVKMLQRGNHADVQPLVEATGLYPVSIEDNLAMTPATTADYWHAGLMFVAPVLRYTIALLWIFSGLTSIWGFPIEQSYQLLNQVGIHDTLKPVALYGAAILDLLLGFATLFSYRLRVVGCLLILLMLVYSIIVTIALPEQWLHPFGPITKNVPLIVATWIMVVLSEKR